MKSDAKSSRLNVDASKMVSGGCRRVEMNLPRFTFVGSTGPPAFGVSLIGFLPWAFALIFPVVCKGNKMAL
jgi:hypothetical protein